MMQALLIAAIPTLLSEVGQAVRQHLEHRRQQKAIASQAARIDALEAKVEALSQRRKAKPR